MKSRTVSAGRRVYFIDERIDLKGQKYLTIKESPIGEGESHRIFVYPKYLGAFIEALNDVAASLT